MWAFGIVIGLALCYAMHRIRVNENRKGCVYDAETHCWHKGR